ncbi:hypothetical protein SAMN05444972_11724 [Marininema halotolerans]|uniref:Uncharacterized protein n=1 Tax=Marininema halotolerans TaxID=1155944 RepID=A0A1I6UJZ3_9BACL|nr:hypothetical protein SAMN05444972_11724 [Marininema halotolerans]
MNRHFDGFFLRFFLEKNLLIHLDRSFFTNRKRLVGHYNTDIIEQNAPGSPEKRRKILE